MAAEFGPTLDAPLVRAVAEALPLRAGSVDAVVAAQAFHWFDFDVALAEIHRVLRPGGGLGLIWNLRDEHHDWVARLGDVRRRYGDIRYDSGEWRDAIERSPWFGSLGERQFAYEQVLEPEGVVELMASRSFIAALPPPEHAAVRDEIRNLLAHHPDTAGRERLVLPYRTDVYWTQAV
jgi:SAM-dependent methyltransferase